MRSPEHFLYLNLKILNICVFNCCLSCIYGEFEILDRVRKHLVSHLCIESIDSGIVI